MKKNNTGYIKNVILNREEKLRSIEKLETLEIYNIYNFYQEIYKNEIEENIFDLNNPSSGNTSSKRQFK